MCRACGKMKWKRLMLLTIAPCVPFVFWPHELYDLGDAFLAYNGTMYAPIVGIVFVDFFVLRRQRLSLWAIFEGAPSGAYHYSHGFHWPALASLILGQGLYLFLFNPITGEIHDLFQIHAGVGRRLWRSRADLLAGDTSDAEEPPRRTVNASQPSGRTEHLTDATDRRPLPNRG